MKEIVIEDTRPDRPYTWVTLYNPDTEHKDQLAHFDCFHAATAYLNQNGYSIVYLDDDRANGGQYWGVRKWARE